MNTLRISPSAYIDGLTLPELNAELVLAASRLVGTRVVQSSISPQHVCRECAGRATERLAVLHTEACPVGMVAHLLLAIAHAEAANVSPTHRKEPSRQENSQSREPSRAAAQEKRPFVLQPRKHAYEEPWQVGVGNLVIDANRRIIVDPHGSELTEGEELSYMLRIVACVNHCAGVPTEALVAETARATAGGGR